jgi:RimJ/RimL family protein N-acetyltransferase
MAARPDDFGASDHEIVRTGRHVALALLTPVYYPTLHRELSRDSVARTWRQRSRDVAVSEFEAWFLDGAHVSHVILADAGRLVGVAQLLAFDSYDGHADIAVASFEGAESGIVLEGAALFIDECFRRFPLRKMYASMSESSSQAVGRGIASYFTMEARLRSHLFLDGVYEDLLIFSTTRSEWIEMSSAGTLGMALGVTGWSSSPTNLSRSQLTEFLRMLPHDEIEWRDVADSMEMIEVMLMIEHVAGRAIPVELIDSTVTVGELRGLVESLIPDALGD